MERLTNLFDADPLSSKRVTPDPARGGLESQEAVGGVRPLHPDVIDESGSAAHRSERSVLGGDLGRQDAGSPEPVEERRGGHEPAGVVCDRQLQLPSLDDRFGGREVGWSAHATWDDYAPAKAVPAQLGSQPQDALFVQTHAGVRDGLAGTLGVADNRVQVRGDPLQFGVQHTNQLGRPRWLDAAHGLECLAECDRVRHRSGSLHPLGQQDGVIDYEVAKTHSSPRCLWYGRIRRWGISSPGVSTRYSTLSNTPERTGPYGIVKTPSPLT